MSSARPSEPRLAQRNPVNAIEGIDGPDPLDYDYTFDAITAIFLWPSAVFCHYPRQLCIAQGVSGFGFAVANYPV